MIALVLACAGAPDDSAVPDPGDTAPAGPVALTDASNYAYTAALSIGTSPILAAADATLDWSGLTTDLRGFPMNPATDVVGVDVVWLRDLSEDEAEAALVAGEITQASVGLFATVQPFPGSTGVDLGELDLYGSPFDPARYMTVEGGSWIARIATMQNSDAMVRFLDPPSGDATVALDDTSATLDFEADLGTLAPVALDGTVVDWSGLTRDSRGAAIDPLDLQELWIARYDAFDVATLQERFFQLETLANATYTVNVYGESSVDLTTARDASGAAFSGVDADATWLLALRCLVCTQPAPVYLTVLTPP